MSKIAQVWQEVLGLGRGGVHDNFFDLGGHSLLMIQVHSRLRENLKSDVTMVELFEYPTVSALAEHLSRQKGGPDLQAQQDDWADKLRAGRNRLRQRRTRV